MLLPVVAKYRVISARTGYEKFYPGQPLCWKAAAFAHEVNEIFEQLRDDSHSCTSMEATDVSSVESDEDDRLQREIVSFGDSTEERTATNIVAKQLGALPKSVMFLNAPTPLQIIGQLEMLTEHMRYVCESRKSLDFKITKDQADRFSSAYLKRHRIQYDSTLVPNYVPTIHQVSSGEGILASSSG